MWRFRLVLLVALIIFYALLFRPVERNIFSVQFVDEEDNFALATWVLKGKKLYQDFFWQHQPLPTLISAGIQKVNPVNSIFLVVKRHREFIFAFSALSFILLTARFGLIGFVVAVLYEISKFNILGNLFLAESLVVPAVLYCIGSITLLVINGKKSIHIFDLLIISASLLYITFSLLPLIPFVIASIVILLILLAKKMRAKFLLILGFLSGGVILLLSQFISFSAYIEDTININLREYALFDIKDPAVTVVGKILFFPFLIFSYPHNNFYLLLQLLSAAYLIGLVILLLKRKFKVAIISYVLFVTLSMRPWSYGTLYGGFHFLPAFAALIWLALFSIEKSLQLVYPLYKKFAYAAIIAVFIMWLGVYGLREFSRTTDQYNDWYIHYSPYFDYGETIRLLASPDDTLMISTAASLIYWQSKTLPNSRFFFIYGFMYESNKMRKLLSDSFQKSPPVFIYMEQDLAKDAIFSQYSGDYTRVSQNGKPSRLYIKTENFKKIPESAWEAVVRYGFGKESNALLTP